MSGPGAYPLSWPVGWARTRPGARRSTAFRHNGRAISLAAARDRLQAELDRLGAASPLLSTNLELRLDGWPRGGQAEPADPGAACYFTLRGRPMVLACDRWDTVAGNVAAIAAHIEALRGMERWGVGTTEQAFTGYQRIAAETWRDVLGFSADTHVTLEHAEAAYRHRARSAHPDQGGTHAAMARLNAAISEARKELRGG